MTKSLKWSLAWLCIAVLGAPAHAADPTPTAAELIAGLIDLTRGQTSYAEFSMVIHRSAWERTSKLVAWTRGREDALIRFTAPTKDAGNATLKQGQQMWTFTPKLNRVIRLPFSMMSQGWAGSDFSYNDLSRTDQLLHQYDLALAATETRDGHQVYTVDAIPHDDAPVVWGKEQIVLRDDHVLLGQTFFDQAMKPLKRLESREIKTLGGRTFATRMRMVPLDKPDEWTEIVYDQAQFDIDIDDGMFTVFALQSGRSQ
ncbi:MAG TPA: outer membrane lipoprotein-sorting protein [Pseudomonadales bacterium]